MNYPAYPNKAVNVSVSLLFQQLCHNLAVDKSVNDPRIKSIPTINSPYQLKTKLYISFLYMNENASLYLKRLSGDLSDRTPVWLMRQAGRYLPEYRALRAEAGGFWNLVYDPVKAAAVTLQPVERFGMDAAILFSDILVVPHALGQSVTFNTGEGPVLEAIRDLDGLKRLNPAKLPAHISPVCETVERCRAALSLDVTLIGFAGAPWTVAAYMIQGHGKTDFAEARAIARNDPAFMEALLDLIVSSSATYLAAQVRAGAQALQLFDSWAGTLDDIEFQNWVIKPTRRLVRLLRDMNITVPLIGFPRGTKDYAAYATATGVNAIQLDTDVSLEAGQKLAQQVPVQGWIDPEALLAGGATLDAAVDRLKNGMAGLPWLCNLGHGVIKETPPEHVAQLVNRLRQ